MNILSLKDKEIPPTREILACVLDQAFPSFEKFEETLKRHDVDIQWRYYNDGKAWLGKMLFKKKNLGWLHIYNHYFTVTCFFMERHQEAIRESSIPGKVKTEFFQKIITSKLMPMAIHISTENQIDDAIKMLLFKKELK